MKLSTAEAREIINRVSLETGVGLRDILSDYRGPVAVRARWRCFADLRRAGATYCQIGRLMQRDHATVIHGLRRLSEEMRAA